MTKIYKYRSPFFYIFLGLCAFTVAYIFLGSIKLSEFGKNGFQVLVGFFGLTFLVMGIISIKKFIDNFGFSDLKLGDDYIARPGRWSKSTTVSFADIEKIESSFDKVIEISSKNGLHTIDGTRMSIKDFRELQDILTKIKVR